MKWWELMLSAFLLSGEQQEQWLVHTGQESCLKWTITSAAVMNALLCCLVHDFVFWRAQSPQGAHGKVRERWNDPGSWYWARVLSAHFSCQFSPTKCWVLCSGMVLLRSKCSCCSPADRKGAGFEYSNPTWILHRSCYKWGRVLSWCELWEIKLSALYFLQTLRLCGLCEMMNQSLKVHMPDVINGDPLLGLSSIGWKASFRSALGVGTQTSLLKLLWKQERNER